MNDSIITLVTISVPMIGAVVAWIMNGFNSRIKALEIHHDKLVEVKLDKADYHRDQGALRETLKQVQQDIKDLSNVIREVPEKMIALLNTTGKL